MDNFGTILGGIIGGADGSTGVDGTASGGVSALLHPPSSSLYEFALALLVLWLVLEYVPGGIWIGGSILLVTLLSTPQAVTSLSGFLAFVQHPF